MVDMKFLITGFGAFDIYEQNPSQILLEDLKRKSSQEISIETLVLPVSFAQSFTVWKKSFEALEPDVIILLGLAGRREVVSLEKVAINYRDSERVDNEGVAYRGEAICDDGPSAYFSTLPLKKILSSHKLVDRELVELSLSSGSYICNDIFYQVRHYLEQSNQSSLAGFIHIPPFDKIGRDKQAELLFQIIESIANDQDLSTEYKSQLQTD